LRASGCIFGLTVAIDLGAPRSSLTSQLPVGDWPAYLGADRVADAILDRLIHNAHRIE